MAFSVLGTKEFVCN